MNRLVAATAAVAVTLLAAGAASASDYRVAVGDLDLSSPQDAATFDRRIQGVANTACVSGTSMDQLRCRVAFRREVLSQLSDARRDDYARARNERVVVRTPAAQQR